MKNIKKVLGIFLISLICLNFIGCTNKKDKKEEASGLKEVNICTNLDSKDDLYLINYIKNQYESMNAKNRVNIINFSDLKEATYMLNEKKANLLFTDRNSMIQLESKGLIGEMTPIVKEEKLNERYYDIVINYGKHRNGIYGVGILPFSMEILYNKNVADKINIAYPKDIHELFNVFKKLNEKDIEIPVTMPENIEINELLFSIIFNNITFENNIDEFYGSSDKYYKDSKDIQKVFEYINYLYKNNIITNKTFKKMGFDNLKELQEKEYPLFIAAYNGRGLNKFEELYKYQLLDLNKNSFKNIIIVEPVVCVNTDSMDKEEVKKFIKFIYSEDFQQNLSQQGFKTASKAVNNKTTEKNEKVFIDHINYGNKRNMMINHSIPEEINRSIEKIVTKILKGQYTGEEWKEVIKSTYK